MFLLPFGLYCSACFGSLFVSILCTCCSHFYWYCFISFTVFCAPVFCLIHWSFSFCFGILSVSILCTCCSHFSWYFFISFTMFCAPRPRDPWAMQLRLQQTGEGAGESPAPSNWAHSAKGAHPYRKACRSRGIKVAAPPLDSPCDGPVTYPGDTKVLIKSSEGRSWTLFHDFFFFGLPSTSWLCRLSRRHGVQVPIRQCCSN